MSFDAAWDDEDREDEEEGEEEEEEEEECFDGGAEDLPSETDNPSHGPGSTPALRSELQGMQLQQQRPPQNGVSSSPSSIIPVAATPADVDLLHLDREQQQQQPGGSRPAMLGDTAAPTCKASSAPPPFSAMNDLEAAWAMSVDDDDGDGDNDGDENDDDDHGKEEGASRPASKQPAATGPPTDPVVQPLIPSSSDHDRCAMPSRKASPTCTPLADRSPRADAHVAPPDARRVPDFGDEEWQGSERDDEGDANLCSDDNSDGGIEYF